MPVHLTAQQQREKLIFCKNDTYGLIIEYPLDWQKVEEKIGSSQFSIKFISPKENDSDIFQEFLKIDIFPSFNRSLDSMIKERTNKTHAQDFELLDIGQGDINILESKDIIFKNLSSHLLVYNLTSHGTKLKEMTIIVQNGDRFYTISYTAEATKYDRYSDTIKTLIRKLQLFTPSISQPNNFKLYNASLLDFLYPASWNVTEVKVDPVDELLHIEVTSPPEKHSFDPYNETIKFRVQNATNSDCLEDSHDKLLSFSKCWVSEFAIEEFSAIKGRLDLQPAHILNYTLLGDLKLRVMAIFAIQQDKIYTVTYSAQPEKFDTYLPTVQKIIGSLNITRKS
jgi:hypothetical protein